MSTTRPSPASSPGTPMNASEQPSALTSPNATAAPKRSPGSDWSPMDSCVSVIPPAEPKPPEAPQTMVTTPASAAPATSLPGVPTTRSARPSPLTSGWMNDPKDGQPAAEAGGGEPPTKQAATP